MNHRTDRFGGPPRLRPPEPPPADIEVEADKAVRLYEVLLPPPRHAGWVTATAYAQRRDAFRQWAVAQMLVWGQRPRGDKLLEWVLWGPDGAPRPASGAPATHRVAARAQHGVVIHPSRRPP